MFFAINSWRHLFTSRAVRFLNWVQSMLPTKSEMEDSNVNSLSFSTATHR